LIYLKKFEPLNLLSDSLLIVKKPTIYFATIQFSKTRFLPLRFRLFPLQQKGDSIKPASCCQLLFSNFFLLLTFFRTALPSLKVPRNEESRLYLNPIIQSSSFIVNFVSGENNF
jgi:hypothetical protein